jgi:hypothetical protein
MKTLMLSGAFLLATSSLLPAQRARLNDRPTGTWSDEAPRVRVSIDGPRSLGIGAPVRIRFEVSDNAFVTVVRVDDNGRMTILYPYSRTQRAAVRAGVHAVRNPRLGGEVAFVANDRFGGYVFALASYVPLDFSGFENRDYDRIGGYSAFTVANRSIARRPDVFIDRFAARVLWDVDTPYDYDVDYYFGSGYHSTTNAYALCSSLYRYGGSLPYYGAFMWDWDALEFSGYPYRSMCRNYYNGIGCVSSVSYFSFGYFGCGLGGIIVVNGPVTPVPTGEPVDPEFVPNEGVIRGGLFTPTPVPIPVDPDAGTLPRDLPGPRFDQVRPSSELDGFLSIPARATRKMKEEDARDREFRGTTASSTFDRTEATARPERAKGVDAADASTRVQPPSREPTKSKNAGEPRRETTGSRTGFGTTTRNAEPRSAPDRDLGTRPVKPVSAPANPPSVQGTSTVDKKKPPNN